MRPAILRRHVYRLALPHALVIGLGLVIGLTMSSSVASAQNKGFTVNRYEPTPTGEWSFMVDHPWYSSIRWFAGGITLNYGHDPLVYGRLNDQGFTKISSIVEHQLLGHVDLAGSFLDRVTINASLPITFYEGGKAADGIAPRGGGAAPGDLRLGAMVRLWGQPDKDAISIHLGINFWVPFKLDNHQGDAGLRVMPKLVLAGYGHRIRWSTDFAFYYRPEAVIGLGAGNAGNSVGSEIQIGARVQYADKLRHFAIGPEALFSTVVLGGDAFGKSFTSLEILLGAHYHICQQVLIGAAVGLGALREPGTPDARALLRIAYAPERKHKPKDLDSDGDGIIDRLDRCPFDPEDKDGFEDDDGCPDPDNDKDGILDIKDKCPNDPEDKDGFEDEDGCPDPDNDKDGVLDVEDRCPLQPGPRENGGCPDPDRDGDGIVDRLDNCPDEPGDAANHGCKKKQLASINRGKIEIIENVYFETNKDIIMRRSFALLENVAQLVLAHPDIKKVLVEGHTDDRGKLAHNMDLSSRRARAVATFLGMQGVEMSRLDGRGFGPTKPVADNKTVQGRSRNRRVEFTIIGDSAGNDKVEQGPPAEKAQ